MAISKTPKGCFGEIVSKIIPTVSDNTSRAVLNLLMDSMNAEQLREANKIILGVNAGYRKKQKIEAKDFIAKRVETNSNCFQLVPNGCIKNIVSFLPHGGRQPDVESFKLISRRMFIICLELMEKFEIGNSIQSTLHRNKASNAYRTPYNSNAYRLNPSAQNYHNDGSEFCHFTFYDEFKSGNKDKQRQNDTVCNNLSSESSTISVVRPEECKMRTTCIPTYIDGTLNVSNIIDVILSLFVFGFIGASVSKTPPSSGSTFSAS